MSRDTATFEHGVLDATSTLGFDGRPTGTVTTYTGADTRHRELPPADQYNAMIDHVLAVLRGEAESQITPTSTLDALDLTLDIDQKINGTR